MRIAIDYTSALRQAAGIGRYTRGIVHALSAADHDNQYTLLAPSDARAAAQAGGTPDRFRLRILPFSERALTVIWHRLQAPLFADLLAGGADIYHSPDFTLPPLLRATSVLTVHDLSFMRYPECSPAPLLSYLNTVVPRSVRRARLILADSESTRRDLIELLGTDPERITVVYAGVGPEYAPVPDSRDRAAVCARYGLTAPYLLTVGTLQPRKNHLRLIRAFAGLAPRHPSLTLAIAGGRGWLYDEIAAEVASLGLQERVIFPGFVAEADLPAVYSAAEALVFPSLYEGFGLPILEAMACGTPVVSSSASSMPEVAGDAAILVNPLDTDEIEDGMRRALDDTALRAELRRRGLARAARFTWAAAAETLLSAYRGVAAAA